MKYSVIMRDALLGLYFIAAILPDAICENTRIQSSTVASSNGFFEHIKAATIAPSIMVWKKNGTNSLDYDGILYDLSRFIKIIGDITTKKNKRISGEKCILGDNIGGSLEVWKNSVDGVYYYSDPLCLAENKTYLLRECHEGKFDPPPKCNSLQTSHIPSIEYCPDDFEEFRTETGQYYCFVITEKSLPYKASTCKYHYNIFDSSDEELLELARIKSHRYSLWLDIRRNNINGGIGQFTTFELNNYGNVIDVDFKEDNLYDCVILYEGKYIAADCNSSHRRLCVYSPYLNWQYCKWEDLKCINSDINTSNLKCICPTKSATCDNPAELIRPAQNNGIFSADECKLNMLRREDGLIWASSKTKVDLTFWSTMELQVTLGTQMIWKGFGWTTSNSTQFDCTICEVDFPYAEPKLTLSYDKNEKALRLLAQNENSIFKNGFFSIIYCFTDGHEPVDGRTTIIATKISNNLAEFNSNDWTTGSYWCEAFEVKSFRQIATEIVNITVKKFFTLELSTSSDFLNDLTGLEFMYGFYNNLRQTLVHANVDENLELHWVALLKVTRKDERWEGRYLFRILTSKKNQDSYRQLYYEWRNFFDNEWTLVGVVVNSFRNQEFCPNITTISNTKTHVWREAAVNELSTSMNYCVDQGGNEIKITCTGDFHFGTKFETPTDCYVIDVTNSTKSAFTDDLTDLEKSEKPPDEIITSLQNITEQSEKFEAVDIYLVANILHKNRNSSNYNRIFNITSNVMNSHSTVLEKSQQENNATDQILYNLDLTLKSVNLTENTIWIRGDNVISFVFDPCRSLYKGAAFINNSGAAILNSSNLSEIVQTRGLDIAAYMEMEDLNYCSSNVTNSSASVTFFMSSALFNEKNGSNQYETFPKTASILIPDEIQKYQVFILFNYDSKLHTDIPMECTYWKYGNNTFGKWKTSPSANSTNGSISICHYEHATHFGQLIIVKEMLNKKELTLLDAITILESSLSAFGIGVILLTGLLFSEWRCQVKNQILLHYCIVLFIQISFLFMGDKIGDTGDFMCIVLGAVLHFTVLSQFVWTMMIAFNQYRRYVDIYCSNEVVLWQCMLYAYALPLAMVLIVALLFGDTYLDNELNMCYPSGNVHIATVLIPVGFVVICNIYIFVRIFVEMCRSMQRRAGLKCENLDFKAYLKLIILMFFILGITWAFGIIANLFQSVLCLYIFSLSVSIQGFIMFLFFIVFDSNVLHMYVRRIQAFSFNNKLNK